MLRLFTREKRYFGMPAKAWWISIVAVGICLVGFISFLILSPSSRSYIPDDFTTARQAAAGYAQDIVSMLKNTSQAINSTQELEAQYRQSDAVRVILAELQQSKMIRDKAVFLALELEQMAKSIPNIRPQQAGQTALVAVSQEAALIGKLLAYNNDLGQLLTLVQNEITSPTGDVTTINTSIKNLNDEAVSINDLNNQFNQGMQTFDAFYSPNATTTPALTSFAATSTVSTTTDASL